MISLVGMASAGHYDDDTVYYKESISKTYYDSNENSALTRTIYVDYDNEDRYSTYDYRHGYSYRNSEDYWMRHHDYRNYNDVRVIRVYDKDYDYDDDRYYSYGRGHRYDYDRYDRYDRDYRFRYEDRFGDWRYASMPRTQVRYVSYLDSYESRECYNYAPHGRLFYVECD